MTVVFQFTLGESPQHQDDYNSDLLVSGKNKKALGSELGKIYSCLTDIKLSRHLGKTESILFGSSFNLGKVDDLTVNVGANVSTRMIKSPTEPRLHFRGMSFQ